MSGAAFWLGEQAEQIERSVQRLSDDIADLESKIVKAREERDRLNLIRAEMLAARNLIDVAGLKVVRRGTDVVVSVERLFEPAP